MDGIVLVLFCSFLCCFDGVEFWRSVPCGEMLLVFWGVRL